MFTIHKYLIKYNQETNKMYIEIPKSANAFSMCLEDSDKAYVYCVVSNDDKETIEKEVLWIGTGWTLDQETKNKIEQYTFLGTHKYNDLRWHFWIEPMWEEWLVYDFDTNEKTVMSTNPFK